MVLNVKDERDKMIDSLGNKKTADGAIRQKYRELSTQEKEYVRDIKGKAIELYELITVLAKRGLMSSKHLDRSLTRIEEGVTWAVKGITL